jgi:hypothetical protein
MDFSWCYDFDDLQEDSSLKIKDQVHWSIVFVFSTKSRLKNITSMKRFIYVEKKDKYSMKCNE